MKTKSILLTLCLICGCAQIGFAQYNKTFLGENVYVFDPSMNENNIQIFLDSIYNLQCHQNDEFTTRRYALLFKPGTYNLDVRVGYYMHVIGLGASPEDVVIHGAVRSTAIIVGTGSYSTCNFWRSIENLTIEPTTIDTAISNEIPTNTWSVSQAAPMRRVYVKGNLKLWESESSGGFMADCKIDGNIYSGSQQQWISRNSEWKEWIGGVWNMFYLGVKGAPTEDWPNKPVTVVNKTPEVREKPFWAFENGNYELKVPALKENSTGVDWNNELHSKSIPISKFYVAKSTTDNAQTINKALKEGKNILFTPGIYKLNEALEVTRPQTIIIGIGMATLVPEKGNSAINVSDVDGVTVAGIVIDAETTPSKNLMQIGKKGASANHSKDPIFLYDIFVRVGGPHAGATDNCLLINSNNVYVDHVWLWRADHGNGVGWNINKATNGLIVNGNDVTIYGLFNEHFQEYQTIWNGENGRVYLYQSEMAYDVPSVSAWKHGNTNGYASYKVGNQVKNHHAWAVGIYNVFKSAPIIVDQSIETPVQLEENFYHIVTFWLSGNEDSKVKSIINGKGEELNTTHRKSNL